MEDIYSKEVITLEEAKRRDDYVFFCYRIRTDCSGTKKELAGAFSENGDPLRGCAVLEIGFI